MPLKHAAFVNDLQGRSADFFQRVNPQNWAEVTVGIAREIGFQTAVERWTNWETISKDRYSVTLTCFKLVKNILTQDQRVFEER